MIGAQTPQIMIEPHRTATDGDGAALLMEAYGVALDDWQKLILNSILGKDASGQYVTISAGISVPRQNGKSELLIARCFYGLLVNGERILFTAHQLSSVKKIFRRLVNMFTDKKHPEIMATVKKIRNAIGEESIELENGGIIEFKSRSRQGARGFDGISLIIYDEAAELTDEQAEAIMSVLSASKTGTRQVIYAGTPFYIGAGEVFRRFRQSCIDGKGNPNTRNSWHEWGIDDITADLSNKALWYATNPSLGLRITEDWIQEEYNTLSPAGFARERLGYWQKIAENVTELALDAELWDSCASDEPKPEGKTAFGVKFTPDGASVALAGCVIPRDHSAARITLLTVEPLGIGLQWLADFLEERKRTTACVVIDGKNGSDVLIEKIAKAYPLKGSILKPSAQDVITCAAMLKNDLIEKRVNWFREQEELRESAITSTKRQIGSGWGFGGSQCAPIEACALALWGCRTVKRDPSRPMRFG